MWKLVEISQQTYFIYSNFKNTEDVTFVLYDFETTWSQTITLQHVKQKVKLLNKRFDFSEENIKEALSSAAIIEDAVLEEEPNTSVLNRNSCLLKIKYRVKNCILNYEWTLKKQTLAEFQQTFVQPVLLALLECHQQVEILKDNIRKKDIELQQFRIEGMELSRKTLITKPFDFENFSKNYEDCDKIAIDFKELAKYVRKNNSNYELEVTNKHFNVNKNEQDISAQENLKNKEDSSKTTSPKEKKRKAIELKMLYLEEHLKIRRKGLEYDNSQSQNSSSSCSQVMEENVKETRESNSKQHTTIQGRNISSYRKSTRCASIMEDKLDSDVDDHSRTHKEGISLANESKDANKGQKGIADKKNTEDTMQKYVKSSNNLSKVKSKLTKNCLEESNVFDFSNENEDDTFLLIRKNKDKREDVPLLKEKEESFILTFNKDCNDTSPTSSPLINEPIESTIELQFQSNNTNQLSTPFGINEISSQLDNIRKELESLEAMRLADLKQRACKV